MDSSIKYTAIVSAFLLAAAPAALAQNSKANPETASQNETMQVNRGQTGRSLTQAFTQYGSRHLNQTAASRQNAGEARSGSRGAGNLTNRFVKYGSSTNRTQAGSGAGK